MADKTSPVSYNPCNRPESWGQWQKRREEAHSIQNRAFQQAQEALTQLNSILTLKDAHCQKMSTKDNYWSSIHPSVLQNLRQILKIQSDLDKFARDANTWKI
ncbi:hypothetical protein L6164_023889 [Bauhinia variegata]|uniref:Uncharacterized protein n=1 Tax=Bauhinia variegata TaxID=167791 RepID=A0ACB9MJK0_BAUVA|nr:hypothetical protein L6164_023889 [Bauhinia variegata]